MARVEGDMAELSQLIKDTLRVVPASCCRMFIQLEAYCATRPHIQKIFQGKGFQLQLSSNTMHNACSGKSDMALQAHLYAAAGCTYSISRVA